MLSVPAFSLRATSGMATVPYRQTISEYNECLAHVAYRIADMPIYKALGDSVQEEYQALMPRWLLDGC